MSDVEDRARAALEANGWEVTSFFPHDTNPMAGTVVINYSGEARAAGTKPPVQSLEANAEFRVGETQMGDDSLSMAFQAVGTGRPSLVEQEEADPEPADPEPAAEQEEQTEEE